MRDLIHEVGVNIVSDWAGFALSAGAVIIWQLCRGLWKERRDKLQRWGTYLRSSYAGILIRLAATPFVFTLIILFGIGSIPALLAFIIPAGAVMLADEERVGPLTATILSGLPFVVSAIFISRRAYSTPRVFKATLNIFLEGLQFAVVLICLVAIISVSYLMLLAIWGSLKADVGPALVSGLVLISIVPVCMATISGGLLLGYYFWGLYRLYGRGLSFRHLVRVTKRVARMKVARGFEIRVPVPKFKGAD